MSWSKYTSATYAFAYVFFFLFFVIVHDRRLTLIADSTTVDDPGSVGNLDAENVDLLKRFVSLAQQNVCCALHLSEFAADRRHRMSKLC